MSGDQADCVIVGGGHNALVAATRLADRGWEVVVCESAATVGGAVASRVEDGWISDEYSACYPLARVSPALTDLDLHHHGLVWCDTERVVTHVADEHDPEGSAILRDPDATAAKLDADAPGDGDAWLHLVAGFQRIREPLMAALLTQWPPTTSGLAVVRAAGLRHLPDLSRLALLSVEDLGRERFADTRARDLLTGNALHADIHPAAPGSGLYGWLMSMLAQTVGFPVPRGGAGALAAALASRARTAGATLRTSTPVAGIEVSGGRAVGVRLADCGRIRARHAVIANTSATALYGRLLPQDAVPDGLRQRLARFRHDAPTVKLTYRLARPLPWLARAARGATVVHLGGDTASLARWADDLADGTIPRRPFALLGQMTTADPTRSPAGTETMWLYSHLPHGRTDPESVAALTTALTSQLDALAPGWSDAVLAVRVQGPAELAAGNANLELGAIAGGTAQLSQQALWRPVAGLGGPRTHIAGLYLGSSAAHPGGGVHGAPGLLAAKAAWADARPLTRPLGRAWVAASGAVARTAPLF